MAIAGGSRIKSHGGKATRRSLMLPPCCSTSTPRVVTPARGSFMPRRYTPGSLSGGCPGTAVELLVAPRSPALRARDIALSTGSFCCGMYDAVNSRRTPGPLQKSTNILFEYLVPLSVRNARGTPISATKRFTTKHMPAALFSRAPYGRCRRKALSTVRQSRIDPS